MKDKPVLNVNVLDHLIANPELASIESLFWMDDDEIIKGELYFWGTIYENDEGERCVRCLTLTNGILGWGYVRIAHDGLIGEMAPAVVYDMQDTA